MINELISLNFNYENQRIRRIHSFMIRSRKLTKKQSIALNDYWTHMGINFQHNMLDLDLIFGNQSPLVLEIGFGNGITLVNTAENNPYQNFLGIEVYTPGVGNCLAMAKKLNLKNLRIICHDAVEVLNTMIPNNTLNIVQLFFPDPWSKKRHHKRRIIQSQFAKLLRYKLKIGGILHIATDCESYATHILQIIHEIDGYTNQSDNNDYIARPETRPLTKFEQRGKKLGHKIWDIMFKRTL
ncbi:tRNA (guanosine(46)-N7)-methyltransferase TrmB [Pantoea sp. Mhis]|uniref:tRNA (guanosine(46)-N7)-methyltransferase TrmB n=1 Tax=Pantoea sp. Mhis TaxID=2576759 RepID=UPI00135A44FF|nr:tRNA (guanosine(46)-N7)-methyltransferase TrmB [Pantoea sp. Mhis]MXP56693.1 tRNA (guanosine(46)-N7)-methyltransferase TrmB [Pantoea sp. Mhis]